MIDFIKLNDTLRKLEVLSQKDQIYKSKYDKLCDLCINGKNKKLAKQFGGEVVCRHYSAKCDSIRIHKSCELRKDKLMRILNDLETENHTYWKKALMTFSDYIGCCSEYYTRDENLYDFDKYILPIVKIIMHRFKYAEHFKYCLDELVLQDDGDGNNLHKYKIVQILDWIMTLDPDATYPNK